ncbi:MAG TPA: hypothetical protein PLM82_12965 [Candidatus Latescibacteria bacterium]|nr:hypothetical protein [Candidatus Latescibacterota bacterium]
MMRKMTTLVLAALCVLVRNLAQGATIIHDAGRDLALNTTSANVYTNVYGGVWSYMYASSYESVSPRSLMPTIRYYESATEHDVEGLKIVLERGPSVPKPSSGYQLPVIAVNPRAVNDTSNLTVHASDSRYPAIKPGQISIHPGQDHCAVLRFTVPRDGSYTVTAKFWNQNKGIFGMTVQTNGILTQPRQAWTGSQHIGEVYDFSVPAATYKSGDTIEVTIDKDTHLDSNAAGVEFKIAEEVQAVVDASTAFKANVLSAAPANPFTTTDGDWQGAYNWNGPATQMNRLSLVPGYTRSSQGSGCIGVAFEKDGTLQLPWLVVNASDSYVIETNSVGLATTCQGRALIPGEMMCHPDITKPVYCRFVPDVAGVYDIGLVARDPFRNLALGDPNNGVNVWLLQGGQVLAQTVVRVEGGPSNASIFLRGVPVAPNIPFDVAIDSNGHHSFDGTAFLFAMVKTGDLPATYNANAALKANMTSATPSNPFSYNGATWTLGTLAQGWQGAFTPYTTIQPDRFANTTKGYGENATTSPYMCVNVVDRTLTPEETGAFSAGRDMLLGHPKSDNSATAIRFTAPATGVYSAMGWFKDCNGLGPSGIINGVDVHIVANGRNAAVTVVQSEGIVAPYGRLQAEGLHLLAGETLAFAVGSFGAYNYDLTGFYAWIESTEDLAALKHVNIDFDGYGAGETAVTFTGGGRAGWSGEAWDSFAIADAATAATTRSLYAIGTNGSERVDVTLSIVRDSGTITASAQGTATDTSAAALFADGIVSVSTNDTYTFTLTGLLPDTAYDLYFYSRALTTTPATDETTIRGSFTVNGVTELSTCPWFTDFFGDFAKVTASADAEGTLTGIFASAAEADAFWCGLQISGPGFVSYIPGGTLISIR